MYKRQEGIEIKTAYQSQLSLQFVRFLWDLPIYLCNQPWDMYQFLHLWFSPIYLVHVRQWISKSQPFPLEYSNIVVNLWSYLLDEEALHYCRALWQPNMISNCTFSKHIFIYFTVLMKWHNFTKIYILIRWRTAWQLQQLNPILHGGLWSPPYVSHESLSPWAWDFVQI